MDTERYEDRNSSGDNVIHKDMKEKGIQREEAQYQRSWRMKTLCANPKWEKVEEEVVSLSVLLLPGCSTH